MSVRVNMTFKSALVCLLMLSMVCGALSAVDTLPPGLPHPYGKLGKSLSRFEMLNKRVETAKGADLIFLGDSITQYWELAGKEVWEKYYQKRHALNLGVAGDRTYNVLWRMENGNLKGLHPRLVVLMIGTNNMGLSRQTPEQTIEGVKAVVESLRAKLPEVRILLLAVFPRGGPGRGIRKNVETVNAGLKSLNDDKWVYYRDIGPKFLSADGSISKDVMADGLHLTAAGYQIWADAIEPDVKSLLAK
jgi:lysophospholipase L1-like esterase